MSNNEDNGDGSAPTGKHSPESLSARSSPPPPRQGTTEADDKEWYYEVGGSSVGPVTDRDLRMHLEFGRITRDTPVWKRAFGDVWKPLRETAIGKSDRVSPPPVPVGRVNHAYAWILAVVPLVGAIVEAFLGTVVAIDKAPVTFILLAYFVICSYFAFMDSLQIEKSGRNIEGVATTVWLWLAPVYLFQRARALKQLPLQFALWIVAFWLAVSGAYIYVLPKPLLSAFTPKCDATDVVEKTKEAFASVPLVRQFSIRVHEVQNVREISLLSGKRTCGARFVTTIGTEVSGVYTIELQGIEFQVYLELLAF